jgi:hypothetical protein
MKSGGSVLAAAGYCRLLLTLGRLLLLSATATAKARGALETWLDDPKQKDPLETGLDGPRYKNLLETWLVGPRHQDLI